jgi:uncharacterized OsmC-like protein
VGIAEGEVEEEDKVIVLKRIHVTYHLKLEDDAEKRAAAERVLAAHVKYCPVARSIMPAIDITTSLEIEPA